MQRIQYILNGGDLGRGAALDLTESLVRVNTVFGENITVFLVGLFHLPEKGTGNGEEGIDGLEGTVAGLGVNY